VEKILKKYINNKLSQMKNNILKGTIIVMTIVAFVSCNKEEGLQQYFVKNQDNPNFISLDIPASILDLNKTELSKEDKEAISSFKKLNVLIFKLNGDNSIEYKKEKVTLKKILKQNNFKELMRFKQENRSVVVKYIGSDTSMNEVVVFGYSNKEGFAIARILGKNMQPSKIMKLIASLKGKSINKKQLEEIKQVFS